MPWKMQTSATGYKRKEKLVLCLSISVGRKSGSYSLRRQFESVLRHHFTKGEIDMLKFLSKWLPPFSLIFDAAFAICCFYEGWMVPGVITALVCAMTFVELFVTSDYRKKWARSQKTEVLVSRHNLFSQRPARKLGSENLIFLENRGIIFIQRLRKG